MPADHLTPGSAAPADRLSLHAVPVRTDGGGASPSIKMWDGTTCHCPCFADEDA